MNGKIDIKTLLQKLSLRWYYFLFTMCAVLALAFLFVEFTPRVYLIRASIMLNTEVKSGIQSEKFLKEMELFTPKTEIDDEIGILKSYDLIRTAIRKLDFGVSYLERKNFKTVEKYRDFPFTVVLDSTVNQLVGVPIFITRTSDKTFSVDVSGKDLGTFNFRENRAGESIAAIDIHAVCFNDKPFEHKNLRFKIKFSDSPFQPDSDGAQRYFVIHDLNSVAEQYQDNMDVKPITRESNIVEISLKGSVPAKEILFMNTLMEVYVMKELEERNQLGLKTIDFIDGQLGNVSEELKQAESSLESFRSRKNILDINATAENLTKNLDRLEIDKLKLESKLKFYQSIDRALEKGNDLKNVVVPSTFGLEDPLLNDLILELSRLNQERTGLKYSAKEGNPITDVIDLKIANHRKALLENVNNFIDASGSAITELNRQIDQIQYGIRSLPRSERELVNIQRKFDFNDNVYNYLLEKRAEAGIAIASNMVEKRIVDRAKQVGREPVFPNKKLILLLAFVAGFGVSVGIIIVKDLVSENIVTIQDVEKSTRIPFVGTITHGSKRERASPIVAHTKSELGESFRSLRVNLQYLNLDKENNVIGVTSSIINEGKTFCSINLAASVALSGRRTVLIDADMRRPRIASAFKIKRDKGLSTFLAGNCTVPEIIVSTPIDKLDIITSGPLPANPLDLIGHPRMEELIRKLRQTYNTIVIDSPPIGYVAEYIIIKGHTSLNLYVVRSNYTSRYHLEKINKLYKEKKIQNVSIVLNDARLSTNGYRYAYE
jgi:capsular exopolysaccharide synthesis family protein